MQTLPEAEWSKVVKNYTDLYGSVEQYTNQLKALEKARDEKPDNPAMRFLLGYHFGYLGYPKQAVTELDKALAFEPRDLGAQKLRDDFATAAGLPARAPTPGPPPGATPPATQPAVPAPPVPEPPTGQTPATPATDKVPEVPPPEAAPPPDKAPGAVPAPPKNLTATAKGVAA
jgi:tetratricopeptide (TPR) repeat protein